MKENFSQGDELGDTFGDRPSNSEVLACMEEMQDAAANFRDKIEKYHRTALMNDGVDLSTKSVLEIEALNWAAVLKVLDEEREKARERHVQALAMLKKHKIGE